MSDPDYHDWLHHMGSKSEPPSPDPSPWSHSVIAGTASAIAGKRADLESHERALAAHVAGAAHSLAHRDFMRLSNYRDSATAHRASIRAHQLDTTTDNQAAAAAHREASNVHLAARDQYGMSSGFRRWHQQIADNHGGLADAASWRGPRPAIPKVAKHAEIKKTVGRVAIKAAKAVVPDAAATHATHAATQARVGNRLKAAGHASAAAGHTLASVAGWNPDLYNKTHGHLRTKGYTNLGAHIGAAAHTALHAGLSWAGSAAGVPGVGTVLSHALDPHHFKGHARAIAGHAVATAHDAAGVAKDVAGAAGQAARFGHRLATHIATHARQLGARLSRGDTSPHVKKMSEALAGLTKC